MVAPDCSSRPVIIRHLAPRATLWWSCPSECGALRMHHQFAFYAGKLFVIVYTMILIISWEVYGQRFLGLRKLDLPIAPRILLGNPISGAVTNEGWQGHHQPPKTKSDKSTEYGVKSSSCRRKALVQLTPDLLGELFRYSALRLGCGNSHWP